MQNLEIVHHKRFDFLEELPIELGDIVHENGGISSVVHFQSILSQTERFLFVLLTTSNGLYYICKFNSTNSV